MKSSRYSMSTSPRDLPSITSPEQRDQIDSPRVAFSDSAYVTLPAIDLKPGGMIRNGNLVSTSYERSNINLPEFSNKGMTGPQQFSLGTYEDNRTVRLPMQNHRDPDNDLDHAKQNRAEDLGNGLPFATTKPKRRRSKTKKSEHIYPETGQINKENSHSSINVGTPTYDSIKVEEEDNSTMTEKEDDLIMAEKEDDLIMAKNQDISKITEKEDVSIMAEKEDKSIMAEKDDKSIMAEKDDQSIIAEKDDQSIMAEKKDISIMATANTTEKCPVQIQQKGPSDVDDETGGASDTCSAASDVSPTHLTAHARRCSNCAQLQQQAGSASPTKSPTKSMRRLSNATTNSVTRLDTNKQKSEMKSPAVSSPMLARPSTAKPSPVAKQGPSSILIIGGWTPEGRTAAVTCLDISDGALDLAEDITPLPYAWSDASVSADQQGTCIYITGGRAEVKAGRGVEERLDQAAKYDVKARKWSRLLQLNIPREEHCSFVLGGRLYVVGGWDAVDHHDSMESLALTGQTKPVWKKEASLPLPLWQAAICLVKGKVYLTGGHKETPYNHLMEWGARQTKWRPLESMTHARYGHSMCTDEVGHLWVIGGDSGSSVESYNIKTSQWTMLSPLPLWRRDTGCVYHNGVIVVPGGWGKIKDARGGQTNDIWMYDVGGDTWTQPDTKLHQTISCCRVHILPRISSK